MDQITSVELKRDCEAVQIPLGAARLLRAGTPVNITQTLGGSVTVQCAEGLFRIAERDADALGLQAATGAPKPAEPSAPLDEKLVWDTLKTCYDPEIPVNIVDLGLVYDMSIAPLPGGAANVLVKMTLTAPGCGMGGVIASDAREKIMSLPGVGDATVEIVWDPPWHQSMITAAGRRVLGLE